MTTFRVFGALAILSTLSAAPALAQPMIDEPGMYAFYHPHGDLGIGSTRPAADAFAMAPLRGSVMMKMKMAPHSARVRR